MIKVIKIILAIAGAVFIILQFIPYGRPVNQPVAGNDLLEVTETPDEVKVLLKNTCYDCHSQKVAFPWYSKVAPVSWLVSSDIKEGREHLDFGIWKDYSKKEKLKLLDKIGDEVSEGNMPLKIYLAMHKEARLSQEQRDQVTQWAENLAEEILEEKR